MQLPWSTFLQRDFNDSKGFSVEETGGNKTFLTNPTCLVESWGGIWVILLFSKVFQLLMKIPLMDLFSIRVMHIVHSALDKILLPTHQFLLYFLMYRETGNSRNQVFKMGDLNGFQERLCFSPLIRKGVQRSSPVAGVYPLISMLREIPNPACELHENIGSHGWISTQRKLKWIKILFSPLYVSSLF